ncbi:unnamed protein product [Cochlearia groenlandica]
MGFSDKTHQETTDDKKWVISQISIRAPPMLKPISLSSSSSVANTEDQDLYPTTPKAVSVRIPTVFPCPPAPKKRKRSLKFSYNGAREFFTPPDLETVFIHRGKPT